MSKAEHIVVGISGGVDSAVAAHLLKAQGHRVTGVFMKNWEEDDDAEYCAAEEDLKYARAVCERLDIPLRTVNFSAEYWDRVFEYFLAEYRAGRTPNPDVMCNKEIKFAAFLDFALDLGADKLATGHYARVRKIDGHFELLRGLDEDKDQSYFLCALGQRELGHTRFPLGEIKKPEVRRIAETLGLPNFDRKDSTGICFIGERRFTDFLQQYLPAQPGEIKALDGKLIGTHQGLMYHTIGQRKGLDIGGPGEAWYVAAKDLDTNTLYVVQGHDHPALLYDALDAADMNWIAGMAPALPLNCTTKIRYRQQDVPCTVADTDSGLQVHFKTPVRAVSPGQALVLYDGEVCLGGATIRAGHALEGPLVAA